MWDRNTWNHMTVGEQMTYQTGIVTLNDIFVFKLLVSYKNT